MEPRGREPHRGRVGMFTAEELLAVPVGEQLCDNLTREHPALDLDNVALYRCLATAALNVTTAVGAYKAHLRASPSARCAVAYALAKLAGPWSWSTPTARQIWLGQDDMQPRWQLVQNPTGDALPSKPIGGLWTSSQLPDGTSGWQPIIDSGYLGATTRHVITPLELHLEDLQIFRVERATDWHNLCRRFPRRVTSGLDLDWPAAAREYDGIHLPPVGLIMAQEVSVGDGTERTCLRGWDAESTVWLRSPQGAVG